MLFMIIAGSTVFGHFLIVTKIPLIAADWVAGLALPRFLIVIVILFIYQLGGSFMDDLAFMVLATPIFFPIIVKLGYDPIWFGIMIGINLIIGVVIPPVAANVFAVRTVTGLSFGVIYSGVYPFLIAMVICGILIFIFPQIALFLPKILMG
jgi:TRAP-type C4-dicarboxylate transport system permease large subunit